MERQGTTNILNKNVRSGSIFREPSPTPSYYSKRHSSTFDNYNIMYNNNDSVFNDNEYYSRRGSFALNGNKRRLSGMHSNSTQGIQQNELYERSSSKLTLDEELFDILHAFGESDLKPTGGGDEKSKEKEQHVVKEDVVKPSTRQNLLDLIRQKREVINKLRCQPWDMSRKRRTLRLARKYLEQNESKVSRTHAIKEELTKAWFKFKRWFSNIHTYFIPWESKIKKIESHFGSVVSSYFTFLRWIVFMNLIITVIVVGFIVIPEVLADAAADGARKMRTSSRKMVPENEVNLTTKLQVVWQFDGYLKYSPIFYGYYSDDKYVGTKVKYALPLAYFVIVLLVFGYSFFTILRKMAANARLSKMAGSKSEQYIFNWKVFTGWDFTIGNSETASNSVMAIVIKLRESIAESKTRQKQKLKWFQVVTRIFTNTIITLMLGASIFIIYFAVHSSSSNTNQNVLYGENLLSKNQVPSIVATITHVFPMIFDLIGKVEHYHPRTALRFHLGRVLILYFINYATLIIALFDKLDNIRTASLTEGSPIFDEIPLEGEMYFRLRRQLGGMNKQLGRFTAEASRGSPRRNFTWRAFLNYMESTVVPIIESGEVEHGKMTGIGDDYDGRDKVYSSHPKSLITTFETTTPTIVDTTFVTTTPVYEDEIKNLTTPDKDLVSISGIRAYKTNTTTEKAKFKTKKPLKISKISPIPILKAYTPKLKKFPTTTPVLRAGQWRGRKTKNPKFLTSTPKTPNYNKTVEDARNSKYKTAIVLRKPNNNSLSNKIKESYYLPSTNMTKDNELICWETMIGQEIVRLVTMDLYITIASIFVIDFLRGLWVRYCSTWWFWDLETTFPEYGEFKVAENVLHIINNQGMIWLGLFFAPLLPAINNIKLIILMYIRGWTVMTCNVPANEIFRDSRSSNFYLMVLLIWLLLCTVPVGYVIASKRPSSTCGPFAGSDNFYKVVTHVLEEKVDPKLLKWLRFLVSPGVIIPIMLVLFLTIYFLVSLVRGLREANSDLKQQLVHERTEEKKKIFELAGGGIKKKDTFFTALSKNSAIFPGHDNNKGRKKSGKTEKLKIHVCDLEEKKREPWRMYNGTSNELSLIPSDEREEINNLKNMNTPPSTREQSFNNILLQQMSNNNFKEIKNINNNDVGMSSITESQYEGENRRELGRSGQRYSIVIPIPHRQHKLSGSIHEDDSSSIISDLNTSKKTIPLPNTPDEVKSLMKNFQSAEYLNKSSSIGLSLASFPTVLSNSNFSTNDLTVVFQSSSGKQNPSKTASIQIGGSITSLDGHQKILPLSVRKNSTSCKNLEETETKGSVIKDVGNVTRSNEKIQQQQHYKILEEGSNNEAKSDLTRNVYQQQKVSNTFQPWPSIEEVKNKRNTLKPIKGKIKESEKTEIVFNKPSSITKGTDNVIKRAKMELKHLTKVMKNENSGERVKNNYNDNCLEKTPLSVPMRKKNIFSATKLLSTAINAASHGADVLLGRSGDDKEDKKKLTRRVNEPSKICSDPVLRLAPRVEFGDDDSPRVASD